MKTLTVVVNGKDVRTCGEGYIVNHDDWTKGFVNDQAEGLELTEKYWDVVRLLRTKESIRIR